MKTFGELRQKIEATSRGALEQIVRDITEVWLDGRQDVLPSGRETRDAYS